jgi:radical SAM C-methyltransferase
VSRIAVYPILLLPNTDYVEKRREHGIVSVRGDHDDFEYVLAHETMSYADNVRMQRFLFWSRVLADAAVLRVTWPALRELGGMTQSQVLRNFDAWIEAATGDDVIPLRDAVAIGTDAPGAAIEYLYRQHEAKGILARWWQEAIQPVVPAELRPVLDELFRYDLLTHPVHAERDGSADGTLRTVDLGGEDFVVRESVPFGYDVRAIVGCLRSGTPPDLTPRPTMLDLYYRTGVEDFITTTNSEEIVHFMGMTLDDIVGPAESPMSSDGPYAALLRDTSACS